MVVGFNHNVRYRDQIFHIQTEDSGLKSPHIITLLYVGGTILASRKTSYADISKVDNLEGVVEELMKEQHKGMLRALKNGDYDPQIDRFLGKPAAAQAPAAKAPTAAPPAPPATPVIPVAPVTPAAPATAVAPRPAAPPVAPAPPRPAASAPKAPAAAAAGSDKPEPPRSQSLDDIILSYLVGEDDDK